MGEWILAAYLGCLWLIGLLSGAGLLWKCGREWKEVGEINGKQHAKKIDQQEHAPAP